LTLLSVLLTVARQFVIYTRFPIILSAEAGKTSICWCLWKRTSVTNI